MKIIQIVKKLNNTELGKGGTHDTYVLIPNDLDVSDVFPEPGKSVDFADKNTKETVTVRNTVSREKRIVGLGQYYRNMDLYAGDEIIFEKKIQSDSERYLIYTKKYLDHLAIQKSKYGFEILTPERLTMFQQMINDIGADITISFLSAEKKRNDSPETTDFYDVIISGESLLDLYTGKDIVELRIDGNKIHHSSFYGWKKYVFETEA